MAMKLWENFEFPTYACERNCSYGLWSNYTIVSNCKPMPVLRVK